MNICSMIIIMHYSVSSILTKTVTNTYIAAYMHSQVKHYNIYTYICTQITLINHSVNCMYALT